MVWLAVHQDLGLDDRDEPGLLREDGVARQRVRVDVDAVRARLLLAVDGDDGAPLGELGAHLAVLVEALAQSVEALGDRLALGAGQRLRALVDLDAGDDARVLEHLRERHAVLARLADGLVVEDDAGDVVAQAGRREQHLPVVPALVLGGLDLDRLEALLDRPRALVRGQDALPGGHERVRGRFQRFLRHHQLLPRFSGKKYSITLNEGARETGPLRLLPGSRARSGTR